MQTPGRFYEERAAELRNDQVTAASFDRVETNIVVIKSFVWTYEEKSREPF